MALRNMPDMSFTKGRMGRNSESQTDPNPETVWNSDLPLTAEALKQPLPRVRVREQLHERQGPG
jgi:hypothetical protein